MQCNTSGYAPIFSSALLESSLGQSHLPNLIQTGRAISSPRQIEVNCGQTHMHIPYTYIGT